MAGEHHQYLIRHLVTPGGVQGAFQGEPPLDTIHTFSTDVGLPGVLQAGGWPDGDSQSHLPGSLARARR